MLGKLIGAAAGYQASQYMTRINAPGGALLGAVVPVIIRRIGVAGMVGAAAGAYLATRYFNARDRLAALPVTPQADHI